MAVIMLPGGGFEEQLLLSELVSLEDAGFEDGIYPMRDIDTDYVMQLAETPAQDLPAIKVVKVSLNGMVRSAVIDGYHRWEAAKVRGDQSLKAVAFTYRTENAVIMDAFEANFKHGLKASKATRTDYALWIYYTDTDGKISLREIAKIAGLNVSTVSRAILKSKREESGEETSERTSPEITASKKLVNALHKFYEEERTLLGSFGKGDSSRDVKHRAKALYRHIASQPKEKHSEIVRELASLNETLDAFLTMVETPATVNE